uniref:Uncharacterized protein n=1 Tax=viral metagenome TaxID=1070528 RepID=A0A6M3L2U3_9ZZZZ
MADLDIQTLSESEVTILSEAEFTTLREWPLDWSSIRAVAMGTFAAGAVASGTD